jgi:hypothetical protein
MKLFGFAFLGEIRFIRTPLKGDRMVVRYAKHTDIELKIRFVPWVKLGLSPFFVDLTDCLSLQIMV